MKTGRTMLAAVGATIVLPVLTSTAAIADPPPGGVTIEIATVNGTGCRKGTAAVAFSEDLSTLTITRSDMRADAGGAAGPTDDLKGCQVNLRVHVPQGHSYAIRSSEYSGTAHLEPGASGTVTALTYFQGQPDLRHMTQTLKGPFSHPWRVTFLDENPIYSPCGEQRNLNISADVRVDLGTSDPSKPSHMTMDGKGIYHFAWKRCPAT
ncbi:DUF4360 domain-containing protein [Actinomadura sp. 9N215]|uniref:DUF4360 domain-containing protein n=1 Tax=Actinomadura sp. 9N215 TaxID=3375150 RepID=UPI0037C0C025